MIDRSRWLCWMGGTLLLAATSMATLAAEVAADVKSASKTVTAPPLIAEAPDALAALKRFEAIPNGASSAAVRLPGTQEFAALSSDDQAYRIFVAVPDAPPPPHGYPVLYVLDGNASFASAANAMRVMSLFPQSSAVQPMIVVGVGYPGDALLDHTRRTWDFLPPANGMGIAARAMLGGVKPGGAAAFIRFLVDELRPALAKQFAIDEQAQGLMGHSLGGYFALHALVQRPGAFKVYAAISPSIWWDDRRLLNEAKGLAQTLPADYRASIFLAVADDETPGHPDRSAIMLNGATAMNTVLTDLHQPGVTLKFQVLKGENHLSTPLLVMPETMRLVSNVAAR